MIRNTCPRRKELLTGLLIVVVLASAVVWAPSQGYTSKVEASQLRPTITPIPRPTLVSPASASGDRPEQIQGAWIKLVVAPPVLHAGTWWAEVQWQDQKGSWHTVDGWRGSLEAGLHLRWWVGPEQQGRGPFRWVVTQSEDNASVLWASRPFQLPLGGKEIVLVANLAQ